MLKVSWVHKSKFEFAKRTASNILAPLNLYIFGMKHDSQQNCWHWSLTRNEGNPVSVQKRLNWIFLSGFVRILQAFSSTTCFYYYFWNKKDTAVLLRSWEQPFVASVHSDFREQRRKRVSNSNKQKWYRHSKWENVDTWVQNHICLRFLQETGLDEKTQMERSGISSWEIIETRTQRNSFSAPPSLFW